MLALGAHALAPAAAARVQSVPQGEFDGFSTLVANTAISALGCVISSCYSAARFVIRGLAIRYAAGRAAYRVHIGRHISGRRGHITHTGARPSHLLCDDGLVCTERWTSAAHADGHVDLSSLQFRAGVHGG
jgi:hypothetical protein